MAIAFTLKQYLDDKNVDYDVLTHKHTHSSEATSRASHIPGQALAKGVVLTREGGFILAIVPASSKVRIDVLERLFHCPIGMANEDEIAEIFPDCEEGAVPPVAEAYAVDTLIDESLDKLSDVYLEAGDHRSVIHISGEQFRELTRDFPHARIAAGN
jgi:Ala-tRNA(Pro) deacylase